MIDFYLAMILHSWFVCLKCASEKLNSEQYSEQAGFFVFDHRRKNPLMKFCAFVPAFLSVCIRWVAIQNF